MIKKNKKNIFKYYFVGTQIAVTVFVSTIVGYQIDVFLKNNNYVTTIVFSATAIVYTLYSLVKQINKEK